MVPFAGAQCALAALDSEVILERKGQTWKILRSVESKLQKLERANWFLVRSWLKSKQQ